MSETVAPLDMDACAREPIHIPGSIQPHGVLLVIEPGDGRIVQASANAAELLDVPPADLLGQRYDALLTLQAPRMPADAAERAHLGYSDVHFPRRATAPRQRWVGAWHLYPEQWLLELEPRDAPLADATLREALPLLRRLESDSSLDEACQRAAKNLRTLIGYDRVMIYRFDDEWNGDVVAEARTPELESYLGLHYPATDIPVQARTLYLRNRVRQIADVGYIPSPIQPTLHPRLRAPVDLSDVSLRSVSPVHLEYLANMGVTATLVASIVVNDALWGLIACHHYRPYFCNHEMRDVTDAVSRALAGRIGALTAVARARVESVLLTVREKLITNFNEAENLTGDMLDDMASDLLDVVDADGVAVFHGDHVTRHGTVPSAAELARIREQIEASHHEALRHDAVGALHTDQTGATFPELADLASTAAGFIFVPLMPQARSALLWTRREQVRTVNWAGNPQLSKLQDIPNARLSPRKSFDLWQETVRGRARPWSPLSLESARSLRVLIELMERKRFQQDFALLEASLSRLREPVAIIERGSDGRASRLAFVNDAFAALYQREIAELIGCDLDQLYASDAAPAETQRIATLLRQGRAAYVTLPLRIDATAAVHRQFDFEPLPSPSGVSTHWLLQLRDPR
ncbi:bacteriophytochrome BphP [Xanthomonas translucens]|uniref:bacteriophytochrome BphP n=1 Tax=Xanthomonas campestris pv. translucens TaxID=343 RepID=UPI0002A79FBA|nr:bacteriophytochrome BphP [Xanthomonas translucens]ELQ10868.1 phytochrome-like protein [Xanthomonas translucens DAR61454]MBC3972777.1 GAF domain-containing protein [Xanthomonas translucens pv. undulosa]MCT8283798.1 GAF domain-containing protein [Xanthomonas translucens pv. undulosa]MCT8318597.1 GAF domain-containing protein [Xanthomonas translucens pv. undulosa]QSQ56332.1 GAF domain-containing protein [Xanthomonas translucens pv. undulosa]